MRRLLILIFIGFEIFITFGCKKENPENDFDSIPDSVILNFNTDYKQFVHPDLIYVPSKEKYFLTATPYPYGNDRVENPYIFTSKKTCLFREDPNIDNPIAKAPKIDHNDDPDLFFDDDSNIFYLVYLETCRPLYQDVIFLKSYDAIHWNNTYKIHYDFSKNDIFIVSPAIIKSEDTLYLFYVNLNKLSIEFLKGQNLFSLDKNNARTVFCKLPESFHPWHLDIIRYKDDYFMLLNAFMGKYYTLFLYTSKDLIHWNFKSEILRPSDLKQFDCKRVYRSTGIIENDILTLIFSFESNKKVWKIGRKLFNIKNLVP